jgi:signal transduction histidine kinase
VDGLDNLFIDGHPLVDTQRPSRRALNGEVLRNVTVELRGPGEQRVLSISAAPLPHDPDDHARAVLLIRDATTEHAQREELAAFAGVVAHDLRNPLAAIDGWTELLEDAAADGELPPGVVQEFIGRLRASSTRMHGLILHLLAHATSKNRNLSLARLDLTESAQRVVAGRDASDFVTVGAIPPAHGDRVLIDQVLENLIGNALKYVAAGVRPEVDVRGCLDSEGLVRVTVTDNGIGLPEGQHEAIFDEFHRVNPAGYEGTGLGLAIARRIVTRHGGTIIARSNPAGGTIFEFTLPAA